MSYLIGEDPRWAPAFASGSVSPALFPVHGSDSDNCIHNLRHNSPLENLKNLPTCSGSKAALGQNVLQTLVYEYKGGDIAYKIGIWLRLLER